MEQPTEQLLAYEAEVNRVIQEKYIIKAHHITEIWSNFFIGASSKKRIGLVYVANDLIQKSNA
jgi:hypothetical protein